jgi:Leucine-rich repeat (LRR) protein
MDSHSSLLSIKNRRKKIQSSLSTHSKTQETIDTAPFTIHSPVHTPKNEEKPHDNEHQTPNEIINKRKQSSPEIKPEDKIMNDE